MLDLDALIEEAVISGEILSGTPSQFLAMHGDARMVAVLGAGRGRERQKAEDWTDEEEKFVVENMRWMTDAEIAQKLGRSADAIKIHRFRYIGCASRRKDPEWPTLQQVMRIMGVSCQKTVAMWVNQGLIAARVLPTPTENEIRAISRTTLYRWAVNPENWIYFKPERVADPYLRRLIELRRQRWHDEWWTPGQAGAYHGVTHMAINNRINLGTLPAKRWGNWWIKRSDVMALRIFPQKGFHQAIDWTSASDAFLVVARALGYSYRAISKLCGWDDGRVVFRLTTLLEQGEIPHLIQEHRLAVQYNPATGDLFADWRDYPGRFPRLEEAIRRFLEGQPNAHDLLYVGYTLATWAQWHAQTDTQRQRAVSIRHGQQTARALQGHWQMLRVWGLEPL